MSRHPAGTFLIKNCVGRDIGKFFYGGYKMEHNEDNIQVNPYRHTMAARKIIRELVIGRIEVLAPEAETKIIRKVEICEGVANFHFQALDEKAKPWSLFYKDIRNIGRIFLVHDVDNLNIQRQYTICTTIRKEFFEAISLAVD